MKFFIPVAVIALTACADINNNRQTNTAVQAACSAEWYQFIDQKVQTRDAQQHGPDLGSDEWKSVIEFRLGVRGESNVPAKDSDAWCSYIDQQVRKKTVTTAQNESALSQQPSYACGKVLPDSIEAIICADRELSALDQKLSDVYAAALKKSVNEMPPQLQAQQRGWIKGRNDCWKNEDQRECIRQNYQQRIVELQARYQLVQSSGPFYYACDGNPANEIVVTFFQTQPSTLMAERGDSVSLMVIQPSASGTKYQGRNESFWQHQGEALITWGYGAAAMRCMKVDK